MKYGTCEPFQENTESGNKLSEFFPSKVKIHTLPSSMHFIRNYQKNYNLKYISIFSTACVLFQSGNHLIWYYIGW